MKRRLLLFYIPKQAIVPFRSERQQQQQHAGWIAGKKFISVLDGQTYFQKQQVPSHVSIFPVFFRKFCRA
jgi:hypothetical protein